MRRNNRHVQQGWLGELGLSWCCWCGTNQYELKMMKSTNTLRICLCFSNALPLVSIKLRECERIALVLHLRSKIYLY
jgi:hypothetical protein